MTECQMTTLWLGAFRYYVGRTTYAVSDFCDLLIASWPTLPENMKRKAAYAWLAKELGIPVERCHIGEFDVDMCQRVEDACDRWFQQHMSSNDQVEPRR